MPAGSWSVICRVISSNDGSGPLPMNRSGLAVMLTDGDPQHEHEVCRVAFDRSAATKKAKRDVSFTDALTEEIGKAEEAAEVINGLLDDFDRARAEDELKAQEKVREILGKPSESLV